MSEMMGCDLNFVVPLTWRGPDVTKPMYGGGSYTEMTLAVDIPFSSYEDDPWNVTAQADRLHVTWCGELNYGWEGEEDAAAALAWLQGHRVPYIATTDAKYEFDGERDVFDGVDIHSSTGTNAGAVLSQREWERLLADETWTTQASDHNRWLVWQVDAFFKRHNLDLSTVDISHLPAEPPTDEEDEE